MYEAKVKRSSASSSDIGHEMRGAWAVGLRKVLNMPTSRVAKPRCSLLCDSLAKGIDAQHWAPAR